ncbi:MAG: ABC transporter ATP-binding protein [Smithellaceae bacterium]|nr:ABC transporter ATP-binding protein [Smithellaceae bacterium]
MISPLLEITGLKTCFHTKRGIVKALDGIDLELLPGDTLGIVGESGCGKTVLAQSIMRLVPTPPGRIVAGRISFNGTDLLRIRPHEMRAVRGREISMIFQEPMTSLNPVFRIGDQVGEVLRIHNEISRRDSLDQATEHLRQVGIPSPETRIRDYPHQLSGGMRQRVMIAMALACKPKLLIADEPTTALDVTIQAQILELIDRMKGETGASVIMITHDLGVIAETARQVAVMYAGKVVEYALVDQIYSSPLHPYTMGLLQSIPRFDSETRDTRLCPIPGVVPNLYELPRGCAFQERCHEVMDMCKEEMPQLLPHGTDQLVRCWKYQ